MASNVPALDRLQAVAKLTVQEAFDQGALIRHLYRDRREELLAALIREVGQLCKVVDAKKTITDDVELIETVQAIIDEFPTLRLEEFALIARDMRQGKYGKFYERLKMAEILSAIRHYEAGPRCDYLEYRHKQPEAGAEQRRGPVEIKYVPPKPQHNPNMSMLSNDEVVQMELIRGTFIPDHLRRDPAEVLREAEEASSLRSRTQSGPDTPQILSESKESASPDVTPKQQNP